MELSGTNNVGGYVTGVGLAFSQKLALYHTRLLSSLLYDVIENICKCMLSDIQRLCIESDILLMRLYYAQFVYL